MLNGVSTQVLAIISQASTEAAVIAIGLIALVAGFAIFGFIRESLMMDDDYHALLRKYDDDHPDNR